MTPMLPYFRVCTTTLRSIKAPPGWSTTRLFDNRLKDLLLDSPNAAQIFTAVIIVNSGVLLQTLKPQNPGSYCNNLAALHLLQNIQELGGHSYSASKAQLDLISPRPLIPTKDKRGS